MIRYLKFVTETKEKHYKIYEDGRTEGFEPDAIIVNRYPIEIARIQGSAILSDSCPSKNLTSDESG